MMRPSDTNTPFLFYSYSHKDDKYRKDMEDSLLEAVNVVVKRKNTPDYELVGYF